jgi:shikimate kinase
MLARPVCLIGLRCSGKSALGRRLSTALGVPFHDLDHELALDWAREAKQPKGAAPAAGELLTRLGEPAFRLRETASLERLLAHGDPAVIATGAGCIETERARELLLQRATCLWLQVELPELARRMKASPTLRPALLGGDPVEEIPRIARRRAPLYRAVAPLVLECDDDPLEQLVERALELLKKG